MTHGHGLRTRDQPLNRRELGTFSSLAFNTCNNIALAVVAHTSTKSISKRHLMRNTVEIGLDRWRSLDNEEQKDWKLIVIHCVLLPIASARIYRAGHSRNATQTLEKIKPRAAGAP
jgi:hypothetical protein